MKKLQIALVSLARTTFDIDLATQVANTANKNLEQAGFCLIKPANLITDIHSAEKLAQEISTESIDLLLLLQATFADSTMVTTIAEAIDAPIFLWAVPEKRAGGRLRLNSLCGINLAAHALTLRGYQYDYAYLPPDDASIIMKLKVLASAGNLKRRLKSARLGVVGEHPDGMDSCHLDEKSLKNTLGVSIEKIALRKVFDIARRTEKHEIKSIRSILDDKLDNLDSLDQKPLEGTLSAYSALKTLALELKLDGLAVRCWPEFFTDLGCAACGAMSMLSDGLGLSTPIPCSCEADINGTITQLLLQWLAEKPAFGTDLVSMDFEEDVAVFWHCGLAPLSMADPQVTPRGGIHSNRKVPLVMDFTLKPGDVTLARISQSTGALRLVVGKGNMLRTEPSFSGTSGVIRFSRHSRQVFDTLMKEGLEHHLSLVYGEYLPELLAYARLTNLPTLTL